ncbi:hypothetical protein YC2023_029428 [Brassica napus]
MTIELCSIRGDCKLINRIHWDFIVDDERGSSLNMILEDIIYNDSIGVILENFGIDVSPFKLNSINLSYVSPSKLNFSSKELPLVFIKNDRQVASYLNKLQENGGLHLCVTIKITTWNFLLRFSEGNTMFKKIGVAERERRHMFLYNLIRQHSSFSCNRD